MREIPTQDGITWCITLGGAAGPLVRELLFRSDHEQSRVAGNEGLALSPEIAETTRALISSSNYLMRPWSIS